MLKERLLHIGDRKTVQIRGAAGVQRRVKVVGVAAHPGADGAGVLPVATVPVGLHKIAAEHMSDLRKRDALPFGIAVSAVRGAAPCLQQIRLRQTGEHPPDAHGVCTDVLRQIIARQHRALMIQKHQRVDGYDKITVDGTSPDLSLSRLLFRAALSARENLARVPLQNFGCRISSLM